MKDIYIYPAIFENDDGGYMVTFPDFKGCINYGDTIEEALDMASDALSGRIACIEGDGDDLPEPTSVKNITINSEQFVQFIKVYMPPARKNYYEQVIRRNVTIPRWLDDHAKKDHLNVSAFLQEALKNRYQAKA